MRFQACLSKVILAVALRDWALLSVALDLVGLAKRLGNTMIVTNEPQFPVERFKSKKNRLAVIFVYRPLSLM